MDSVVKLSTAAHGISEHGSIFRTVRSGQGSLTGAITLCANAVYTYNVWSPPCHFFAGAAGAAPLFFGGSGCPFSVGCGGD